MTEPGTMAAIGKAVKTGFAKTKDLIVGETKRILEDHKKRFDKLDKEVKEVSAAVADIRGEIKAMNAKLDAIKEIGQSTDRRVENLDGKIDGTRRELEGKIDGARTHIEKEIEKSSRELKERLDLVVSLVSPPRP